MITFALETNEYLANAPGQSVKRVGFSKMRGNAVDDFDAYLLREAIDRVRIGMV